MDDVASSEEEKETNVSCYEKISTWNFIKNDLWLFRNDFFLLRFLALCGMTFCFAMVFIQIGTSLRSYELLRQYIEEKEAQYSFIDFYESNEFWSWDPDLFLLTVNTTLYVH